MGTVKLERSGCGRKFSEAHDCRERAVRDLPWSEFKTAVHIEVYRVKCPDCGVKVEKVPLLPSKAPFSNRFEDAVGQVECSGNVVWAGPGGFVTRCRRNHLPAALSLCRMVLRGLGRCPTPPH